MPDRIALRELTAQERAELERIAPAHLVQRATILLGAAAGRAVGRIAHEAGVSRPTVSAWVRRFNDGGPAALGDRPRSGRPPTYTAEQRAAVVAAALTDPKQLGLPFASWTLDRLQAYLNEQKGIAMRRSRIDELLTGEGLRWRHQETWFGERVDPDFAEKGGHRAALHRPAGELGGRLPRRDGAGERQELPGTAIDAAARGTSSALSARPPARR